MRITSVPAGVARALPRRPERARMAHMQIAGRRRRKPAAIAGVIHWDEGGHAALILERCRQPDDSAHDA